MGKDSTRRERDERSHDTGGTAPPGLADDRLYQALAARQRRRLLFYLLDAGEATVGELAEILLGWESAASNVPPRQHDRVMTSLRHSHLPALTDAGLLTYSPATATATLRELDESVVELVERSIAAERDGG